MNLTKNPDSLSRIWHEVLERLVQDNGLIAAVLTDFQGLPFASALHHEWRKRWEEAQLPQEITDILAAFAPPLFKTSYQLRNYVGNLHVEEISLRTCESFFIVSRVISFSDGGEPLILTALVPPRRAYRRAMNRAIRAIQRRGREEIA